MKKLLFAFLILAAVTSQAYQTVLVDTDGNLKYPNNFILGAGNAITNQPIYLTNWVDGTRPYTPITNYTVVYTTNQFFASPAGISAVTNNSFVWNATIGCYTNGPQLATYDPVAQFWVIGLGPLSSLASGSANAEYDDGTGDPNAFTLNGDTWAADTIGVNPGPVTFLATNSIITNIVNNIASISTNFNVVLQTNSTLTFGTQPLGSLGNKFGYIREFNDTRYILPSWMALAVSNSFASLPTNLWAFVNTNGNDGTATLGDPSRPWKNPASAFSAAPSNGIIWFQGYSQSNHISPSTVIDKRLTVVLNQNILDDNLHSFGGFTITTNASVDWYGGLMPNITFVMNGGSVSCYYTRIGDPLEPSANVDCFVFYGNVSIHHCFLFSTFDTFNNFPPNPALNAFIYDSFVYCDESFLNTNNQARCIRSLTSGAPGKCIVRDSTLAAVGSYEGGAGVDANVNIELTNSVALLDNVTLICSRNKSLGVNLNIGTGATVFLKNMPLVPVLTTNVTGNGVITNIFP